MGFKVPEASAVEAGVATLGVTGLMSRGLLTQRVHIHYYYGIRSPKP